jgi:hypothetical protein
VRRLLVSILGLALSAGLLVAPVSALQPIYDLTLVQEWWYEFDNTTDANGVDCLSDEDTWERTWVADRYTGTFTASVYLCPWNENAPVGPTNMDIWMAYWVQGGGASLTLTYPDGTVVSAIHNPVTDWIEVCMYADPDIPDSSTSRDPGVYTLTFVGDVARKPVVKLETSYAENVRGRYWWGCPPPPWWDGS